MLKLNLGCSDATPQPGFINVDRWEPPWATADNFQRVDLDGPWPWADGGVEHVRAVDILEHLSDFTHTMNELHRVLKPGGTAEIIIPTTDGRGAFQDPTHKVFLNRNSFFYFEHGNPHLERFKDAYGITARFKIAFEREETLQDGVTKLRIVLEAVKGDPAAEREAAFERIEKAYRMIDPVTEIVGKRPAFSIIHTSARPNEWRKVYDAWLASAVHPEQVEYVICIDERWGFPSQADAAYGEELSGLRPQDRVIWNTGRRCYVDGVNLAAAASSGDVLIVNADDQYPCDKWDEALKTVIARQKWDDTEAVEKDDYVISVSTNTPKEHERNIMVMPILSRERYERFGWVFYPAYESMMADDDFCAMAKRDRCIIDARHLIFPHKHWINGQREKDEQDRAQNSEQAYNEGAKLFAARKRINFAGIPPKVEEVKDKSLPAVVIMTPGNGFCGVWFDAYVKLFGYMTSRYNVATLRQYTSNAAITRTIMARQIQEQEFPTPIEFLLWIDDDNAITPEQLEMLMADLRNHPEYDAVVGWTWCGNDDSLDVGRATISCGWLKDCEPTADGQDVQFTKIRQITPKEMFESKTDLIEIGYSGFPVVLMRFSLLGKVGPRLFAPYADPRCEVGVGGEDVAFFARGTIRSGARYAVNRRVKVPHFKMRPIEPVLTKEQNEEALRQTLAQMAMK